MILYKFYGFDAGIEALKSSQLGFRKPEYFNDPFELSYFDNLENDDTSIAIKDRIKEIRNSVAILSLTKNPLNALMWAHYGVNHTGFVIGYEVNTSFLLSESHNLITVDKGDVNYVSSKAPQIPTRSFSELIHIINCKSKSIPISYYEYSEHAITLARQLFLTKFLPWSYEEEVRVVKSSNAYEYDENHNCHSLNDWYSLVEHYSPTYSEEIVKGLKIYSHKVQIKEVYLGARNRLLSKCAHDSISDCTISHKAEQEKWKVFEVSVNKDSWDLKADITDPDALSMVTSSQGALNKVSLSASEALFLKEKLKDMSLESWDSVHVTNLGGKFFIRKNAQFK